MRAGQLRSKITVQKPTETQNSFGEPISTWSTYCSRSADIIYVSGVESYEAHQQYGQRTIKFKLRYDSLTKAITPKMRISFDSSLFDIQDVSPDRGGHRDVFITCTENIT